MSALHSSSKGWTHFVISLRFRVFVSCGRIICHLERQRTECEELMERRNNLWPAISILLQLLAERCATSFPAYEIDSIIFRLEISSSCREKSHNDLSARFAMTIRVFHALKRLLIKHNRKERKRAHFVISFQSFSWVISSTQNLFRVQVVFNEVRTLLIASSRLLWACQTLTISIESISNNGSRRIIYPQRICTCAHQSASAETLQKPVHRCKS